MEVLREQIRAYVEVERRKWVDLGAPLSVAECDEELAVIDRAIETLEALESQGVIVATGSELTTGLFTSSEDSTAERLRALEDGLRDVGGHNARAPRSEAQVAIGNIVRRLLHPHKSWCRAEHEGVCIRDEEVAGVDEMIDAERDEVDCGE